MGHLAGPLRLSFSRCTNTLRSWKAAVPPWSPLLLRPAKVWHCGPRPCALVGPHRHDETSRKHYRSEARIKSQEARRPARLCSFYLASPRCSLRPSPGKPGSTDQRSALPAGPGATPGGPPLEERGGGDAAASLAQRRAEADAGARPRRGSSG